jgi:hypothetical protein
MRKNFQKKPSISTTVHCAHEKIMCITVSMLVYLNAFGYHIVFGRRLDLIVFWMFFVLSHDEKPRDSNSEVD